MGRRPALLPIIFLGPFVALLIAPPPASAATGPVKIGIFLSYTGPTNPQAVDLTRGFELYLAKVGGKAGGRELAILKEDTEAKPDVGLTKVKKLVERDGVDILMGPVSSAVGLAIRPYVQAQGVPLVIPLAFTRELTAPGKNIPSAFRLVETTDQSNFAMGGWMVKHTPYRKLIVMATDWVAGRHSADAFMAGFKAAGGQVVKEIYSPLNTADYAPYLAQLTATPGDAVWAWFAGADAIRFVKQYQEYGLKGKLPLYGYNTLTDDVILPAIGDAALGIITVGHYTAAIDTPVNKAFVQEYERKYNIWPSRYSEVGYVAAQLIVAAVEDLKANLADRAKVREALRGAAERIQPPAAPSSSTSTSR